MAIHVNISAAQSILIMHWRYMGVLEVGECNASSNLSYKLFNSLINEIVSLWEKYDAKRIGLKKENP